MRTANYVNYVLFLDLGDCYKDTLAYVIIHGAIHLGAFFCLYVNVNIWLLQHFHLMSKE